MISLTWIFVIITLILTNCETKYKDYGGGYGLGSEHETECWIEIKTGEIIYMPDTLEEQIKKGRWVKFVDRNNIIDSCIVGKEGEVISSYIDEVNFDNKYILVDQKDLDSIFGPVEDHYDKNNDTFLMRKINPSLEGIKQSNFHQYWIINKKIDYVYGPFRQEEYILKKKELGVPVNLKLKFEK